MEHDEDDPLALSDGEETVPVPVGVGSGLPTFRALLGGGADDKEPEPAAPGGAQAAPARAGEAVPAGSSSERRPSGQEKTANERPDAADDSAPLLTSSSSGPRVPGGAGGPVHLTAAEQFDRDVKELMLLYEHQQKMDDIYKLSRFQLVFEDEAIEKQYCHFFGLLQEHKVRLRLLGLNFLIMLYSTIEWFSAELSNPLYLVVTRSIYLTVNVTLFILSLVYRDTYRAYIHVFGAILISITSLLVMSEGLLLNIIYSPIVILVLIVYVVIAAAYVRVRYIIWLACSVGTFMVYDIMALTKVISGDSFVKPADIPRYLIVYNIVFLFIIFSVITITKKIELSYRIGFALALKQYRDPQFRTGSGAKPFDDKRFMPFQEVFASLGPKRESMEAHSASNLAALMEKNKSTSLMGMWPKLNEARPDASVPRLANSTDADMPGWMHPAAYIKTGYRLHYSTERALQSAFELHNETVNVWTEFGPMIFFLIAWIVLSLTDPAFRQAGLKDKGLIHAAIAMAFVIRPLCSGFAHLLHCVSERAYVTWWAIDYASIVFTILFGSFVFGRFTFYCLEQQELFFFISVVGLSLSTTAAVIFITNTAVRIGSFFLYVVFANAVPFFYSIYLKFQTSQGGQYDIPDNYLWYWFAMLLLVGLGFVIKATYIPERFLSPGKADILGASHQLWHILINTGNAMSVVAWHYYLNWRAVHACPASKSSFF